MNKKVNTVLFILGATVFNLVVIALLLLLSVAVVGLLVQGTRSTGLASVLMLVFFLASIVGAFFIYGALVKLLSRKVDLDRYFVPLFRKKRQGPGGSR